MARIKYTALIEDIRGSIGGTTFQANAYGYTIKRKPNMIRPNTQYQQIQQIYLSQAVKAWNELTDAQRIDWNTWASTYPQYAKHNLSSELSGFAVFTKLHVLRFMSGFNVLANPTYTSYALDTLSYTLVLSGGVLTLNVFSTTESEFWYLNVSASRPFQPSKNFVGTAPRYFFSANNVTNPFGITAAYLSRFGSLPAVGDRIAISIRAFGESNGQVLARADYILTVSAS